MVITFTQKRKTQKYLVIVFAILISVIAFIYLSDFLKKEEETPVGEVVSKNIPKIEINFQVLESPILKKLSEPYPDLPSALPSGEMGRENPFLPYEATSE